MYFSIREPNYTLKGVEIFTNFVLEMKTPEKGFYIL